MMWPIAMMWPKSVSRNGASAPLGTLPLILLGARKINWVRFTLQKTLQWPSSPLSSSSLSPAPSPSSLSSLLPCMLILCMHIMHTVHSYYACTVFILCMHFMHTMHSYAQYAYDACTVSIAIAIAIIVVIAIAMHAHCVGSISISVLVTDWAQTFASLTYTCGRLHHGTDVLFR